MTRTGILTHTLLAMIGLLVCGQLAIAQPAITDVDLRALQIGATTRLTISGRQFNEQTELVADFPIESQKIVEAKENRLIIDVALSDSAQPGLQAMRILNSKGISLPLIISVDRIPSVAFQSKINSNPAALFGQLRGSQILKTEFSGTAGELVHLEVEGRRIGSKIRAILRVYDAHGAQLQWAQPDNRLGGDTRLSLKLPKTGTYTVEMHDVLFRGSNPAFFRLKFGSFHFADLPFPLAVAVDKSTVIRFPGSSLPADSKLEFQSNQLGWHHITAAQSAHSGTLPSVLVTGIEQVIESAEDPAKISNQPMGTAPLGINGRLTTRGETDRYTMIVIPQQKLRFQMFARRFGSSVDGNLVLKNDKGNRLAGNDDQAKTTDSGFDYTVPNNVRQVILEVNDITGNFGPDHIYSIQITDLGKPRFTLAVSQHPINIPSSSIAILAVTATRDGYQGPIELFADSLPDGFNTSGATIQPGTNIGLLPIASSGQASQKHVLRVIGTAGGETVIAKRATAQIHPWLPEQIGIATTEASPIQISFADEKQPQSQPMYLGGLLTRKVKIERDAKIDGDIRIALRSTQQAPTKQIKENNKPKTIPDPARAIRLTKPVVLSKDQDVAEVQIFIPADLREQSWAYSLSAELLSQDKKQVVAKAVLAPDFFKPQRALTIVGDQQRKLEFDPQQKEPTKLPGEVKRIEGFNHAVTILLTGLPGKAVAEPVVIPADKHEFEISFKIPADIKIEQLKNVNMIGVAKTDKGEQIAVSNPIKLSFSNKKK